MCVCIYTRKNFSSWSDVLAVVLCDGFSNKLYRYKRSIERLHVVLTHVNVCISVWGMCMYECMYACAHVYMCACIRVYTYVFCRDREGSWVFATNASLQLWEQYLWMAVCLTS